MEVVTMDEDAAVSPQPPSRPAEGLRASVEHFKGLVRNHRDQTFSISVDADDLLAVLDEADSAAALRAQVEAARQVEAEMRRIAKGLFDGDEVDVDDADLLLSWADAFAGALAGPVGAPEQRGES